MNDNQAAELINQLRETNRVLVVIAAALEKMANPPVKIEQGNFPKSPTDFMGR